MWLEGAREEADMGKENVDEEGNKGRRGNSLGGCKRVVGRGKIKEAGTVRRGAPVYGRSDSSEPLSQCQAAVLPDWENFPRLGRIMTLMRK